MKEVFIGSSSEAKPKVEKIAEMLESVGIKARRWYEVFPPGLLTYEVIENEARRVAGAVFVATPDDSSIINRKNVKVPRANVMLELGYFSALIGREAIALCRYDEAELPTDLKAFTYVPMGRYVKRTSAHVISGTASDILMKWVDSLSERADGVSHNIVLHGYSGRWKLSQSYEWWRKLKLRRPNYVKFEGELDIYVPPSGRGGHGLILGEMYIEIENRAKRKTYRAKNKMSDFIEQIYCGLDGSLSFETKSHSRLRFDNFGTSLMKTLGISDDYIDPAPSRLTLQPRRGAPLELIGTNEMCAGSVICDRATVVAKKI